MLLVLGLPRFYFDQKFDIWSKCGHITCELPAGVLRHEMECVVS